MAVDRLLNRREFVRRAGAAAVAPTIISATALGRAGRAAPAERLRAGFIGTGGQGTGLLNGFLSQPDVQVLAVCDVDRGRCEAAKRRADEVYSQRQGSTYSSTAAYHDFRELLARGDLDTITVATPDHWHALATIAACQAGCDVYCEKPLANSIAEARAMCEAVKRYGRVLQTGSHERSTPTVRQACELVLNGKIGTLKTIQVNLPCSDGHHNEARAFRQIPPPEPVPEGFDWDFWLGHTPSVPYHSRRSHFWWRFQLAYGGGEMTDRGAHVIDIAQLGNGTDDTGPVEIEASGVQTPGSLYDTFWDYRFRCLYGNGVVMEGTTDGPRGLKFVGTEGWIFIHVHGGALEAEPANVLTATLGPDDIHLGRSPGHVRNFLDNVKTRGTPTAPAEVGCRTATICHLCNIAMATGRTLIWDPVTETIQGDEPAQRRITPSMRSPWHL